MVPVPVCTEQLKPFGCVATVTASPLVLATAVGIVKEVAPDGTVKRSPPLSARTRPPPFRPAILPPTVKDVVAQVTTTLLILAVPAVPVPLATLHVWPAGAVCTVTAYVEPVVIDVLNAKVVAPGLTATVAPLFASTRPLALEPLMV